MIVMITMIIGDDSRKTTDKNDWRGSTLKGISPKGSPKP